MEVVEDLVVVEELQLILWYPEATVFGIYTTLWMGRYRLEEPVTPSHWIGYPGTGLLLEDGMGRLLLVGPVWHGLSGMAMSQNGPSAPC